MKAVLSSLEGLPWVPSLAGWLRETVITALLALLALAGGRAVHALWRRLVRTLARRTPAPLGVELLAGTERAAGRVVTYLVLYAAARRLAELPELAGTLHARILDGLFYALVVLAVTRALVAAVHSLARWYLQEVARRVDSSLDEHLVHVLSWAGAALAYFVAATVVLERFGVSVTALVTTAGVASLAVALAAQETLANLFAGFTLLLDRSYRVGDRIQLPDGTIGDVQDIGLRSTKILSFDNELIVVPNKEMASARIISQSSPNPTLKVRLRVGVAYGTDVERAKRVILEVCRSQPRVLPEPPPAVYLVEFGEWALNLMVVCAIADYRDRFVVLDALHSAIKARFEEEGIVIPFPQRDLHIRTLPADGRLPEREVPAPGPAPTPAPGSNPAGSQEGGRRR